MAVLWLEMFYALTWLMVMWVYVYAKKKIIELCTSDSGALLSVSYKPIQKKKVMVEMQARIMEGL